MTIESLFAAYTLMTTVAAASLGILFGMLFQRYLQSTPRVQEPAVKWSTVFYQCESTEEARKAFIAIKEAEGEVFVSEARVDGDRWSTLYFRRLVNA